MTYPSNASGGVGETVSFSYLPQMVLDTVIGTDTYVYNTDYDAAGRVTRRELGLSGGNAIIQNQYSYYDWTNWTGQGRLQTIISTKGTTYLQGIWYGYDPNGNAWGIHDYVAGNPQAQTFTYDALDRLTSAKAEGGTYGNYSLQYYTYDAGTGNLSSRAGVNYTYGDSNHDHAVTSMSSGESYGYDANGNQTQRNNVGGGNYTLAYDQENRLVSVTGSATATFYYDGDGNRVKASVGGTTTTYVGNYFEWTGSTSTIKKYYYAGTTRIAMRTGSSTLNYLLGDHLGSMAITTDSSGVKSAEIRYYPWGTERYTYGTTPTNYHFTGQRIESSIGLYYYGARWYDGAAGRFIQADSVIPQQQGVQAWDRYAYTNNNPVKYTDPTGHKMQCDPEDPNCNQDDQYENIETESISLILPTELNGEELTKIQQLGKALTVLFVEIVFVAPMEITLVTATITALELGPLGIVLAPALVIGDIVVADFGLSLAINAAESIDSGHDVKFRWTLIPAVISSLPTPMQVFFYELIPGVLP